MSHLSVAAIQLVSSEHLSENLSCAESLISEAVDKNCQFIALPENFPFIGRNEASKQAIAETKNCGTIQTFLSNMAKQHKIWLLGGTIPLKDDDSDLMYAASLLYNSEGKCIAQYNKIHLFDVTADTEGVETYHESATTKAGSEIVIADIQTAKIGLSVCYDLRFPELYRNMLNQGVQIIAIPSAFTATTGRVHWEALLKARAIENLSYIIAPNQGGQHANGRETWGHSMIVDPWGECLTKLDKGAGVAYAKIDLQQQAVLRNRFPSLSHRKLSCPI